MPEQKTVCPIITKDILPISLEAIEPLLGFLQSNSRLPEGDLVFPVGTVTSDGRLDLCKQNLGIEGAAMIVDALKQNQTVKHLLLGTNSIGNQGAKILSAAMQYNNHLETLYLGCNNIESEGAIAICQALDENKGIKSVWFKRNPIGKSSVPALINLLKKNKNIRTLDLVNTCLDEGFFDFFDYLEENNSLERLYLSGNYLTSTHISRLAKAIEHNKSLKALFLSVNNFSNDGAKYLAKGLLKNTILEELSVASCGIQEEGMINLIEALSHNKNLKYLDLGYASSTKVLNSQGNHISDVAAKKMLEFIRQSPQLVAVNLTKTNMSDKYKLYFSNYPGKSIMVDGSAQKNTSSEHPDSKAIKSVYR